MANVEQLLIVLRANTSDFDRKMSGAESKVKAFGSSTGASLGGAEKAIGAGLLVVAGATAKFAAESVKAFVSSTAEVRAFQRVTGASAESSSKMVFALKALGISADDAGRGIFILEKKIGAGKDGLDKFGVSIARTRTGATDVVGTILNIGDAFKRTEDPAKRAALVAAAFGRSGATLIPILGKSREAIRGLFDEAAKTHAIFSQEDLDKGRQYQLAMHELGQTFEGFKREVGAGVTPAITDITTALTSLLQIADQTGVINAFGLAIQAWVSPLRVAAQTTEAFTNALGLTERKTDTYSLVQKLAAKSTQTLNDEIAKGTPHSKAARDATEQLGRANAYLGKSQAAVTEAMKTSKQKEDEQAKALQDLAKTYDQAAQKTKNYTDAVFGAFDAADTLANSQQTLADDIGKSDTPLRQVEKDIRDLTKAAGDKAAQDLGPSATASAKVKASNDAEIFTLTALRDQYPQMAGPINDYIIKLQQSIDTSKTGNATSDATFSVLDGLKGKYGDLAPQITLLEQAIRNEDAAQGTSNESGGAALTVLEGLKGKYKDLDPLIQTIIDRIKGVEGPHNGSLGLDTTDAEAGIQRVSAGLAAISGHPWFVNVQSNGPGASAADIQKWKDAGGTTRALGGPIPGSGPVPITAHGGEYVLSKDVVDRIKSGRASQGAFVDGGSSSKGGPSVNNYYSFTLSAIDTRGMKQAVIAALTDHVQTEGRGQLKRLVGVN